MSRAFLRFFFPPRLPAPLPLSRLPPSTGSTALPLLRTRASKSRLPCARAQGASAAARIAFATKSIRLRGGANSATCASP
eukprot:7455143-Pyramimonas_sp.AAC.1